MAIYISASIVQFCDYIHNSVASTSAYMQEAWQE